MTSHPPTEMSKAPTPTEINHAKGEQVNYWINQINAAAAGKKCENNRQDD